MLGKISAIYPTGFTAAVNCALLDREGFEELRSFEGSGRRLVRRVKAGDRDGPENLLVGDANRKLPGSGSPAHGTGHAGWT